MILFQNDWERFPTAIADFKTPNQSFLKICALFKKMGVKNYLFPLTLLQPHLQGVDPHSPLLTDQQKIDIGVECQYNFWYYIREVVRIPPQGSPNPIPYKANRGNIAMSWAFFCHIDSALIQPRQTGKSVSTDCLMIWLLYLGSINTTINMITKDASLRGKNVERLKKMRDYLPGYLINISRKDADNQSELTYHQLGNHYMTGVAQSSESAANNLGRGLTSPILHVDEGPFIRFIGETIPAALSSGNAAVDEAKANNRPYGNIFTTTAGKKDSRDGKFMYDMIHDGTVWNEKYYDAENASQLEQMLIRNASGRKLLVNITMSHQQLGYSDQWLLDAMVRTKSTGEAADRDYFNKWTSGSQSSPLTTKLNEIIRNSERDPKYLEISRDLYILRWYIEEDEIVDFMANNAIIIGMDSSEAIGRDSITLQFVNPVDLGVVASATVNETNLIRFTNFLADIMIKYPRTVLVPERKSTGQMIVDALLLKLPALGIDPFRRIYSTVVDKSDENPKDYIEVQRAMATRTHHFYDRLKKSFGFTTTAGSRDLLYQVVLQNAAKDAGHLVHDKELINEIQGLVVRGGRIDHGSSGHDDHVVAWMLAHWFLRHTRNLAFYGIDTTRAFKGVVSEGKKLTEEERYRKEQQSSARQQIEEIYDKLSNEVNEMLIVQYERQLKTLSYRLSGDDEVASSVDEMIRQAKEQRQQNARKRHMQGGGGNSARHRQSRATPVIHHV